MYIVAVDLLYSILGMMFSIFTVFCAVLSLLYQKSMLTDLETSSEIRRSGKIQNFVN